MIYYSICINFYIIYTYSILYMGMQGVDYFPQPGTSLTFLFISRSRFDGKSQVTRGYFAMFPGKLIYPWANSIFFVGKDGKRWESHPWKKCESQSMDTHQFSATFTLCLDPCSDKCSMLSANPSNEGSQEGNPHGFLDLDGFGVDNLSSNDLNDANPMSYTILKKCGVCLSNWA